MEDRVTEGREVRAKNIVEDNKQKNGKQTSISYNGYNFYSFACQNTINLFTRKLVNSFT